VRIPCPCPEVAGNVELHMSPADFATGRYVVNSRHPDDL